MSDTPTYFIATDGTKCLSESVREAHETELRARAVLNADIRYLHTQKRLSPKFLRLYYHYWSLWSGFGNPDGGLKSYYGLNNVKHRIIRAVVRQAKRKGWHVWRQGVVLYVETTQGQVSFHVIKPTDFGWAFYKDTYRKWFEQFPEDKHRKWSGVRNSDVILRRCYGEKGAA